MGAAKKLVVIVVLLLALLAGLAVHAQQGRPIQYGQTVQGTITETETDLEFQFSARRGDLLSLSMVTVSGNLDPRLLLLGTSGELLAGSDDGVPGLGAAIGTYEVLQDGIYAIVATRFGRALGSTTGGFELSLQRKGVLSQAGVFLAYGDSVVGSIDENQPSMSYVFEGSRGDIVELHMRRISGNLDSYLYITNESGQLLASNDDREGSLDAEIVDFLILEPGNYTVVASRFGEENGPTSGSFVLTVDTAPRSGQGLTMDSALLVRYGDEVDGILDAETYQRYYTFGAKRGDMVTINAVRTTGSLDPAAVLLSPTGVPLAEDDDSGPGKNALIQSFIIPESGTYFVLVSRFDGAAGQTSGGYLLRVEGLTGEVPIVAPGILTLLPNSRVIGRIDDGTPAVTYAFLASAGEVVTIDLTGTTDDLDPLLFLFSTDSVELANDDDSGPGKNARIKEYSIPQTGTYYVVATRFELQSGKTSGGYELILEVQPAPVSDEGG